MREAVRALMATGQFDLAGATRLLIQLEQNGYTVYRKKQFKNGRRPNVSQPLTPKLAKQIRKYFIANPDATQQEIANTFNVNIGRVNEALEG